MKKLFICLLVTIAPFLSNAQHIFDGYPQDSTIIRFTGATSPLIIPDTSSSRLWQIGLTHKTFFATDTFGTTAMMTDTLNHYPINANRWFILKINNTHLNPIIDFWHKYQTDSFHAGGAVEFSLDTGLTWQNVKGSCNVDMSGMFGIITANFYSTSDTLNNGVQSFMGQSAGLQYSRFQFFWGLPVAKTTSSGCDLQVPVIYVRFRFMSDSTVDSLAGWMIDSIKIENDRYDGAVAQLNKSHTLNIYPNPSYDGTFTLPALDGEEDYHIEVYDAVGRKVLSLPYSHKLDLSASHKGLYFYKAGNGADYYSGQLLVE